MCGSRRLVLSKLWRPYVGVLPLIRLSETVNLPRQIAMSKSLKRVITGASVICALLMMQSAFGSTASYKAMCTKLSSSIDPLAIENVSSRITDARLVEDAVNGDHCVVLGYIASQVGFQLQFPTENWNHKLIEMGCGGFCGDVGSGELCPLSRGYACIATDTGHRGTAVDALWASESWQSKIDWGYLAPHLAVKFGKAMLEHFLNSPVAKSYFIGISNGGRQALIEAQRFPWDFDGIVAIAPPVDISQTFLMFAWGIQAARDTNGRWLLGESELKLLTRAALRKCDLDDGVEDQIISDPLHCDFDPSELLCKEGSQNGCLDSKQVAAAQKIYLGPVTSGGLPLTLGGPLPGSEFSDLHANWSAGWSWVFAANAGQPPLFFELATDGICYLFLESCTTTKWNLDSFNFDRDYKYLRDMEPLYDASNPDLRRFRDAGGKLIVVEGMSDPIVSPREVIDYYESVERTMGGPEATRNFARLFLLPGVDHAGGSGANEIDLLGAIDAWAEQGRPPDKLIAAHIRNAFREQWHGGGFQFPNNPSLIQFTRPVYPYPIRVKYQGFGKVTDASSFVPLQ